MILNLSHYMARGLVLCWLPPREVSEATVPNQAMPGTVWTKNVTYTNEILTSGPYGPAWRSDGLPGRWWEIAAGESVLSQTEFSIFLLTTTDTNRQGGAFGTTGGSDPASRINMNLPWADGTAHFDFGGYSGNNRLSYTLPATRGVWTRIAASAGPEGMRLYFDGDLKASNSASVTRSQHATKMQISCGTGGLFTSHNQTALALMWARQLSEPELLSLTADPFQMFRGSPYNQQWWWNQAAAPTFQPALIRQPTPLTWGAA